MVESGTGRNEAIKAQPSSSGRASSASEAALQRHPATGTTTSQ